MAMTLKPENALKRAEELVSVHQEQAALEVLHDILTSRRYRTWQKPLEDVVLRYIELCVELRNGKFAKDGLIQYRQICQQVNINSLEVVLRKYLDLTVAGAEEAQVKAGITALDIEDLDAEETAETMLSAGTGDHKTLTDRELVNKWLKFLWETYRTVLDVLRLNAKLEPLYQHTAQLAFNFCLKYKRTMEFRRLCEILRNHLQGLSKYSGQLNVINVANPESWQMHLQTRFVQLHVATDLSLWQEAFRSIEDIHGLMVLSKKLPKPSLMSQYYKKLTDIFWMSESHLFHAYAWLKLYLLSKAQNKALTEAELQTMASCVAVSALCVPIQNSRASSEHYFDLDEDKEKNTRLATLMGYTVAPKRTSLLSELVQHGVFHSAFPQLQGLYEILEIDFHPLDMCQKVTPILTFISESPALKQYAAPLKRVILMRLLQQLSQVYTTMKIDDLRNMVSFAPFEQIEKFVVEAVRKHQLHMRVDHQRGSLSFLTQVMETERMRNQLTSLSKHLSQAVDLIQPEVRAQKEQKKRVRNQEILKALESEHKAVLSRKQIIEQRKQDIELRATELEIEARKEREAQEEARAAAETARLAEEARIREVQRVAADQQVRDMQKLKEQAEELERRTGKKLQLDGLTFEERKRLVEREINAIAEEKRRQEQKIALQVRTLDYSTRALRDAERPLRAEALKKQQVEDEETHNQAVAKFMREHRATFEADVETKERIAHMEQDKNAFVTKIMEKRQKAHAEQMAAFKAKLQQEREKMSRHRIDRAKKRAEEARERDRIEQERAEREEAEREKKRAEEEKRRADRAAEEERRAKQDAILAQQRQREAEIEAKRLGQSGPRAPVRGPAPTGDRPTWRDREAQREPERPTTGGWRDREQQRDERPVDRPTGDRPTGGWRDREAQREPEQRPTGGWRDREQQPTGDRPAPGGWRDREQQRDERPVDRPTGDRPTTGGWRDREQQRDVRPTGDRPTGDRPTGDRPTTGGWRDREQQRDERPTTGGWRDREQQGDRPRPFGAPQRPQEAGRPTREQPKEEEKPQEEEGWTAAKPARRTGGR